MSTPDAITLTVGWIARHTPKGAGAGGREAAVLDMAAFLGGLDAEERQLAGVREQDRDLALRLLAEFPGARLAHVGLY